MTASTTLTVISYNIQMTPSIFKLHHNWWNRQNYFTQHMKHLVNDSDPDVIIFQEALYIKTLLAIRELAEVLATFRYQTPILTGQLFLSPLRAVSRMGLLSADTKTNYKIHGNEGVYKQLPALSTKWDSLSGDLSSIKYLTSGVVVVSKHPIKHCHGLIFSCGAFPNSLISKGAVFIQIEKEGKSFNVLGTHLQSGNSYNNVKMEQIAEIYDWIATDKYKNGPINCIHPRIPLIFGGDFNLRFVKDMKFLQMALSPQLLNARTILPRSVSEMEATYNTELNELCDMNENFPFPPLKEIYDYLLLSNSCGGSVKKLQETVISKVKDGIQMRNFKFGFIPFRHTKVNDFSGHFAIIGTFFWEKENP